MIFRIGIVAGAVLPLIAFGAPPIPARVAPSAASRPFSFPVRPSVPAAQQVTALRLFAPASVPAPSAQLSLPFPASAPTLPIPSPAIVDSLRDALSRANARDIPTVQAVSLHPDIANFTLVTGTNAPVTDYGKLWMQANRPNASVAGLSAPDRARMDAFAADATAMARLYRAEWEAGLPAAPPLPDTPADVALTDLLVRLGEVYANPHATGILRDVIVRHLYDDFKAQAIDDEGRGIAKALWAAGDEITIKYFYPVRGVPADGNYRDVLVTNRATGHALWLADYVRAGYPKEF